MIRPKPLATKSQTRWISIPFHPSTSAIRTPWSASQGSGSGPSGIGKRSTIWPATSVRCSSKMTPRGGTRPCATWFEPCSSSTAICPRRNFSTWRQAQNFSSPQTLFPLTIVPHIGTVRRAFRPQQLERSRSYLVCLSSDI